MTIEELKDMAKTYIFDSGNFIPEWQDAIDARTGVKLPEEATIKIIEEIVNDFVRNVESGFVIPHQPPEPCDPKCEDENQKLVDDVVEEEEAFQKQVDELIK